MYANASTPSPSNSSRKRFNPGRNARQSIAGPMESPNTAINRMPLEQAIVLVSLVFIRKNTSAGLVP